MKKSQPKAPPEKKVPSGVGTNFADRDLCNTDPNTEQFEPTDAVPVNQHKRMAGVN